MGVPAFFRWLSRKYPSVIIECSENKTVDDEGRNVYEDATLPNPNGIEFDNLYLDMNGIIHPCTHPEDKPPPKNEDEMMVAIFECIDRLFNIVRPRKLLYMAIDGVAPRAKMNQQRSRRFRAAKESVEKQIQIRKIREELLARGYVLPPEKPKEEHFDSNCITPGTPFMARLSKCLHYYIHDRMNNNPAWKNIKVILSDANVPGEGEHKIMDFIRKQRSQPNHDPNTHHVLCGADADLIMLGLATHEPNFTIIREEFLPNKPRPCDICGQFGHEMEKCQGISTVGDSINAPEVLISGEVKYIFVRLNVLREYLKRTLAMPNLPFKYDFDRALDDWIFMCFFVGNDFLPHLPSLEIREGAVDRLVELYKKCVYRTGGFLTDSGEVNLDRVQLIMNDLGLVEDQIFKERQRREEQYKAREKAKRRKTEEQKPDFDQIFQSQFAPVMLGKNVTPKPIENARREAAQIRINNMNQIKNNSEPLSESAGRGIKRKASEMEEEEKVDDEEVEEDDYQNNDEVRLWEDGFKDRYYESKFDVGPENHEFRYSVALQYIRGLCWVLKYYYQGCASWKWYFPYHYAPFASDFVNIGGLSTKFEKGTQPFNPLEQLMGVFPAASSSHVPEHWAQLMSDPNSPIIDFYPEDFKIDLNGKKFAWQGVALLPFVDENRLFKALEPYYDTLTLEEKQRNIRGDSRLFVSPKNTCYRILTTRYKNNKKDEEEVVMTFEGMQGRVLLADDNIEINGLESPIKGLNDIENNQVITVRFRDPYYDDDFIYPARRLPKAIDPPDVLAPNMRPEGYRPVIGFNRNLPTATLSNAGHRMLNNYVDPRQVNALSSSSQYQNHYQHNPYSNLYESNRNNRNNGNNAYGNKVASPWVKYTESNYNRNNYSSSQNNQQRNYQASSSNYNNRQYGHNNSNNRDRGNEFDNRSRYESNRNYQDNRNYQGNRNYSRQYKQ